MVTFGKPNMKESHRTRVSKCGRFRLQRWEFDLPTRSVEWRLIDTKTGKVHKHLGGVADAKEFCEYILGEDTSRRLVGRAPVSGRGFSVEVTVIQWHPRKKGQPQKRQEVDVKLPGGEILTVEAGDLS